MKGKFSCNKCTKCFNHQSNLIQHQTTHNDPKFSCPFCNKKLRLRTNLKKHFKRRHIETKPELEILWAKFYQNNTGLPTNPYDMGMIPSTNKNKWIRNQKGLKFILYKIIYLDEIAKLEKKILDMERKHEFEILKTKKVQWCAQCLERAVYACCWNNSYCSFECQRKHWPIQ